MGRANGFTFRSSWSGVIGASCLLLACNRDHEPGPKAPPADQPAVVVRSALADQSAVITAKWTALGGAAMLGNPTSTVLAIPAGLSGQYQTFANGVIVASDWYGAIFLTTSIFNKWLATQSQTDAGGASVYGIIGLPINDAAPFKTGTGALFAGGMIADSGTPQAVYGGIYQEYRRLNEQKLDSTTKGQLIDLGMPVDQELTSVSGARYQRFQNGEMEWQAPSDPTKPTQAWPMVNGPILNAWLTPSRGQNSLGFPVGVPTELYNGSGTDVGQSQAFQNGTLYYSVQTGVASVSSVPTGGTGGAGGSSVKPTQNQQYQYFGGPVGSSSSPNPALGFPVDSASVTAAGTIHQEFQNGMIVTTQQGPFANFPQIFTNPLLYVGELASSGKDCAQIPLVSCPGLDMYWDLAWDELTPTNVNIFNAQYGDGKHSSFAADETHKSIPPLTPDLTMRALFRGKDVDTFGHDDLFPEQIYPYNIDNLWGLGHGTYDVTNSDGNHMTGEFGVQSNKAYDPSKALTTEWWSFRNFDTPTLDPETFAETYVDGDLNTSRPDVAAFYNLYKGIAAPGNCFGMGLAAIYAQKNRLTPWPEPIYQYFGDTQQGQVLDPSIKQTTTGPDTSHHDLAHRINVFHGYQFGFQAIEYYVSLFLGGQMHDPKQEFGRGLGYQGIGEPSIVAMSSNVIFADGHAVLATDYDAVVATAPANPLTCVSPIDTAHNCERIHIFNPNVPNGVASQYENHDDFIQIDTTTNHFQYHDSGTGIEYTGDSTSGTTKNGRMFILPYHLFKSQPHSPMSTWLEAAVPTVMILGGSGATVAQGTDTQGRTLFKSEVLTGQATWDDLVETGANALPMAPIPMLDAAGPQGFEMYAGLNLKGATHTYDITSVPSLPNGNQYQETFETAYQTDQLVIPGTIGKPESVTLSNIDTDSASTQLAIRSDAPAKAVMWTISGTEKTRWGEFSNMLMNPGQKISMRTELNGNHVVITNTGPATTAGLRVNKGLGAATIDAGTVAIPTGTTTVDIGNATPWSVGNLNPVAWYLASVPTDLTVSNGTVGTWVDHTHQGHDVSQSNTYGQPHYNPTGWNGTQPTITFTGNNVLSTLGAWSGAPLGSATTDFSVLAVMRSATPQNAAIASWWDVNGGGYVWADVKSTSNETLTEMTRVNAVGDGQTYAGNQDLGTGRHVVVWRYSAADRTLRESVDGTTVASAHQGNATSLGAMPFIIGAKSTLPTGMFQGDISELMVVGRSISDGEVLNYTNYARATWSGLPAQAPTNPCINAQGAAAPTNIRCDDLNGATYGDHCSAGACVGTTAPTGSPAGLSPSAWYYAAPSEVTITDGLVSTWFDRSGQHRDLIQTFYNGRPNYVATGWNAANPTVTFNGGNLLRNDVWGGTPTGTGGAFTVLAVVRANTGQTSSVASWWNGNGYGRVQCEVAPSGANTVAELLREGDGGAIQSLLGTPNLGSGRHVIAWRYSPEVYKVTVDGTTTTSASLPTVGNISPDAFLMGAANYLATQLFVGDISELALIPSSITDAQVASFRTYAQTQWGGLP